jgi:hypothetical protein
MGSEDTVYIMQETEGDEWVSPTPARAAIIEAVTAGTDLDAEDLDDLESYVDPEAVRSVIEAEGERLTFPVEGHEVTLSEEGTIELTDAE